MSAPQKVHMQARALRVKQFPRKSCSQQQTFCFDRKHFVRVTRVCFMCCMQRACVCVSHATRMFMCCMQRACVCVSHVTRMFMCCMQRTCVCVSHATRMFMRCMQRACVLCVACNARVFYVLHATRVCFMCCTESVCLSLFVCLFGWLVGFLKSSSNIRFYRGRAPRQRLTILCAATHETELSVSAGHIILCAYE